MVQIAPVFISHVGEWLSVTLCPSTAVLLAVPTRLCYHWMPFRSHSWRGSVSLHSDHCTLSEAVERSCRFQLRVRRSSAAQSIPGLCCQWVLGPLEPWRSLQVEFPSCWDQVSCRVLWFLLKWMIFPLTIKLFLVAIYFLFPFHPYKKEKPSPRQMFSNIFSEWTMRRCNIHLIKSFVVCFYNGLGFYLRFA